MGSSHFSEESASATGEPGQTHVDLTQKQFWDQAMERFEPTRLDPEAFRKTAGRTLVRFLELIGDPRGMRVLEIGCGKGHLSVYLAKMGAEVTAIDSSSLAVSNTSKLAELNEVNLKVLELDANLLASSGQTYDLVVGQFILHHVEPFDEFTNTLFDLMKPSSRAVFMENSSRNRLLMFFRRFVIGRFGIPKFGDEEEHPLKQSEVELLRQKFPTVTCHYPELLFFRLLNAYLFKNSRLTLKILDPLDAWLFRFKFMRKFTYYQLVEARKN